MAHLSMFVTIMTLAITVYASSDDIEMPSSCAGQSYCTVQPDDYNHRVGEIDRYIAKNKYWAGLGARKSQQYLTPKIVYDDINCGHETKIERPYVISASVNKTNNKNKLVVQSVYFAQEIQTTKCRNKELPCLDEIKTLQGNIKTYCDESHSNITLFVYEGGHIRPQPFPIPVSCSCKVQYELLNNN